MLRPRRRAPQWLRRRPIAHRGLHDPQRPENSLSAFEAAARAAHPIELDVHLSADGEVVVFHDSTLARMTGHLGAIAQTPWPELATLRLRGGPEPIPRLDAVLELVGGRVPVLVELKHGASVGPLERAVRDTLRRHRGSFAVQSFDPWSMDWMRRNAPELPRGLLSGDMQGEGLPLHQTVALRNLLLAPWVRPDFIGYELWSLPYWAPSRWRARGVPLVAWTVRDEGARRRASRVADNIIFEETRPPPPDDA